MNHKLSEISISGSLVVYKPNLVELERTLQALQVAGQEARQNFNVLLEITLVDNSDDTSCFNHLEAWLKRRLSSLACWKVSLLKSPGNIGYGRGNNLVIERTESDYHFVINPDLFVRPKSLVMALNFMQHNPDVGLLVPSVFGDRGNRHYLCKRNPTLFVLFLRSFAPAWFSAYFKSILDWFEMRDLNYNEIIYDVEFPSGCFMLFRTKLLKQLKGFDPDYFMYFEDADIGRRMLKIARVIYLPTVEVVHKWERGTHSNWRLRKETIKSALIYWKKYSLFIFKLNNNIQKLFGHTVSNAGLEPNGYFLSKNNRKKSLRILIMVVYYMPSVMSSAKLIHDLACELQSLGHEVLLAAPDQSITSDYALTMEGRIKVLRIRTGEIKSASWLLRASREIILSSQMWYKGKTVFQQNPADLIIYYSPTIFFGAIVTRLKLLYRCPSYLILRDVFPQWAIDAGVLRHGLIYLFFKLKERQNYSAADVIGVQSPANLHYFLERNLDKKYKLEILYNWANLNEEDIPQTIYRQKWGLQDKIVLIYGGNIGLAQDIDNLIRLAENLHEIKNAYILLVGYGSEVKRLNKVISDKRMKNIGIREPVSQKEFLGMIAEFDIGLISLSANLKTQNFPGKLLSYMYHGKPILASINEDNDLKVVIEKYAAGLVCVNGNDDQFAAYARMLIEDEKMRREYGINSRRLLEEMFSVSRAAGQILSHFQKETGR